MNRHQNPMHNYFDHPPIQKALVVIERANIGDKIVFIIVAFQHWHLDRMRA